MVQCESSRVLNIPSCGPTDVTSKADLEKLVEEISKKEKHIDLLCMTSFSGVRFIN